MQNSCLRNLCQKRLLEDALFLFCRMERDQYCWNLMMSDCIGLGCTDHAFILFDQMQQEGLMPNKFIYATIISGCSMHQDIDPGLRMHARIQSSRERFTADPVVQTALVNFYGSFGKLKIARHIFDEDPGQDVALWNSMLRVLTRDGQAETCWMLYSQMQQLGIIFNKVTCTILLSICTDEANLKQGKALHCWTVNAGLENNVVVGTALVNMYSKCRDIAAAFIIFNNIVHQDIILWNSIISGQALNGMSEEAFRSFNQMEQEGMMPNVSTYTSVLDVCVCPSTLQNGRLLHARVVSMGFTTESAVGAALINMYAKCGVLNAALDIFNKFDGYQNTILWNTMISVYAKHGTYSNTMLLYWKMGRKMIVADNVTFVSILSLVSKNSDLNDGRLIHIHATLIGLDLDVGVANALVSMYGLCGEFLDAFVIFNRTSCQDTITFVNMITACTNQALIAEGRRIHAKIEGTKMEQNVVIGNALVNMYSKCGSLVEAQKMFEKMPEKNVVTWSTIITAYAQHGEGEKAFYRYREMYKKSVIPDNVTLAGLLVAFSHAGNLAEAHVFFHSVIHYHNGLLLEHLNCMIDLLGRSGALDLAEQLVSYMPFLPNSLSWTMLASACFIHMDTIRGCHAVNHALVLDVDDGTTYVLLANIYGASINV